MLGSHWEQRARAERALTDTARATIALADHKETEVFDLVEA